ncbi:cation ABC transporter substrate-binding protein [Desulfosarcina widdelii]|uniref:Cation ABC transporter substrate-binding protein n=1 Tax=Desulfosarcina widdelii TaxID=947919 RepID=A0A5K7Z779_9BACT|nr:zinc ABC transporter substrate-binding protein [Desulfosarcina widdelii]BBO76878.1 cation ABC transporter substrate-binding protein [Desulfosarcina widdelii]
MNRTFFNFLSIICMLFGFASTAAADDKLPVFVSIVPQKFFVQQIGKDLVDVQAMVQPGASPATYEPKPRQMAALSKAKIYFSIGVPFENVWLNKIAAANPQMSLVHTDDGIEKIAMGGHHHHDDHAGKDQEEKHHGDDHEHAGLDPHIWLSPPLVEVQARTITTALQTADPAHRDLYDANFRDFVGRIDQLDNELRQTLAGKSGMSFMVFHPAWGYFAHAYGLRQLPVEVEGKDPKPAQLQALIENAREHDIRVVFVQPQFSTKSAELIAREIGGQVVAANPLAEDWMANLRQVADKFKAALK